MRLYYEWGTRQIQKHGEELCGDSIVVSRKTNSVTVALSDGLGSGVKANILATLTTCIAMHMLENDLPLCEVVRTLSETLPTCQVRKLAYSTFAIAQFFTEGYARVMEFDSPPPIFLRHRKIQPIIHEYSVIEGKEIHESLLNLAVDDLVVFVSDGILNAGIGGVYPLGWGWDQAAHFLEEQAHPDLSAQDIADKIAETVNELYAGVPGDDVSVVVIKVRHKQVLTLLTGPPADRTTDENLVSRFVKRGGRLIVCGGTTAKIVARYFGRPLEVDLQTMTDDVPPMARLEGVNLVTEGILTLTRTSELLRSGAQKKTVMFKTDGGASLVRLLLDADHVYFLVGQALNPAHQNPELPNRLGIRISVVRDIADELSKRGIEVTIESV
ncbi:MAG: SpoIIE family protein phosphatase [Kiritimatiellae bacterium]|nr:SpoIIE family protein phosphatase [Kiritimatiellia bacterium]